MEINDIGYKKLEERVNTPSNNLLKEKFAEKKKREEEESQKIIKEDVQPTMTAEEFMQNRKKSKSGESYLEKLARKQQENKEIVNEPIVSAEITEVTETMEMVEAGISTETITPTPEVKIVSKKEEKTTKPIKQKVISKVVSSPTDSNTVIKREENKPQSEIVIMEELISNQYPQKKNSNVVKTEKAGDQTNKGFNNAFSSDKEYIKKLETVKTELIKATTVKELDEKIVELNILLKKSPDICKGQFTIKQKELGRQIYAIKKSALAMVSCLNRLSTCNTVETLDILYLKSGDESIIHDIAMMRQKELDILNDRKK